MTLPDPVPGYNGATPPRPMKLVAVMVRLTVPSDMPDRQVVQDVRHSIEFGDASVNIQYIIEPPPGMPS